MNEDPRWRLIAFAVTIYRRLRHKSRPQTAVNSWERGSVLPPEVKKPDGR